MRSSTTVRMDHDCVHVGERFSLTLQRTLRLPEDTRNYPLPPGFGPFPLTSVESLGGAIPPRWLERGGFVVPIHQHEALWFQFTATRWKPNAVQVSSGGINAITGGPWTQELSSGPQNYIVCPIQPWLDGINAGNGIVRQFVATASGMGDSIGEQLGASTESALQVGIYEPKRGRFPDAGPAQPDSAMSIFAEPAVDMGIAAGGNMIQKIYPDPYGLETWDKDSLCLVHLFLISPGNYSKLTGRTPPTSPISAEAYTAAGLPWFRLADEQEPNVPPSSRLSGVKTLKQRIEERAAPEGDKAGKENNG